MINQNKWRH